MPLSCPSLSGLVRKRETHVLMGKLTGLGNADDVVTILDGRKTILLDGGRDLVATKLNVLDHCGMQAGVLETHDRDRTNRAFLLKLDLLEPGRII